MRLSLSESLQPVPDLSNSSSSEMVILGMANRLDFFAHYECPLIMCQELGIVFKFFSTDLPALSYS